MSIPHSDRIDDDSEKGSSCSGYDRPRSTRGRNTEGNGGDGGRIPPTGGNVAGGGGPGDSNASYNSDNSDSSLFDWRKILGSCKEHWDDASKAKYDKKVKTTSEAS